MAHKWVGSLETTVVRRLNGAICSDVTGLMMSSQHLTSLVLLQYALINTHLRLESYEITDWICQDITLEENTATINSFVEFTGYIRLVMNNKTIRQHLETERNTSYPSRILESSLENRLVAWMEHWRNRLYEVIASLFASWKYADSYIWVVSMPNLYSVQ
jgi:hypothetical protein